MICLSDYINRLIGRPYTPDFRCWDLVRLVQADLFNRDLPSVPADITSPRAMMREFEHHAEKAKWSLSEMPSQGCIILMGGARREHHAGVYLEVNRGGVIHTLPTTGVQFEPWRDVVARCGTVNIYEPIGQ